MARANPMDEKIARLVSSAGGSGRPTPPPKGILSTLNKPKVAAEEAVVEPPVEKTEVVGMTEPVVNELAVPQRNLEVTPESNKPLEKDEISSYDLEVMKIADSLDVEQLLIDGYVAAELDVLDGKYSVTAKSLRRTDRVDIQKDLDTFNQGLPDPDREGKFIRPTIEAMGNFRQTRELAEILVGLNGEALPGNLPARMQKIDGLADPLYVAILREVSKFMRAVELLLPTKEEKKMLQNLREKLGK